MNRLENLSYLKHPILVCYLPVGDPMMLSNQVKIYAEQGVDVFEVGIPCADPFMDGELVRNTMYRAIEAGVQQVDIFAQALSIRKIYNNKAVVMVGYKNICLEKLKPYGASSFDAWLQIGADAMMISDIPQISFVPYQMSEESIVLACSSSGYVMLQAAAGTTGLRDEFDISNKAKVAKLRSRGVTVPILLGVGISNAEQARQAIDCGADGVVIGSACLAKTLQGEVALTCFLREVREALDGGK